MNKIQELEEKLKAAETQFAEGNKAKDQEIGDLKKELEAERKKTRSKEHADFFDNLVKEGKLIPVMRPRILEFMEILHGVGNHNFAEGGEKPALAEFQEMLKAMPKVVDFKEVATPGKAGENGVDLENPEVLAQAALEFKETEAKAGRVISITEAVNKIKKGGKC